MASYENADEWQTARRSYGGGGRGGRGWGRGRGRGRGGGWGPRGSLPSEEDSIAAREAAWLSRFRRIVLNLGEPEDFHAASEMYAVAQELVDGVAASPDGNTSETIAKAFLAAVTEQPHKHYLHLALISVLAYTSPPPRVREAYVPTPAPVVGEGEDSTPSDGVSAPSPQSPAHTLVDQVIQTMLRAFRSFLDQRLWRSVRLQVRFFSLLAGVELVRRDTLLRLLGAFVAVLDEPAVTAVRGDWAAEVIIEAVLFAGSLLALTPQGDNAEAGHEVTRQDDALAPSAEGDVDGTSAEGPKEGPGAKDLDALAEAVVRYAHARKVSDELVAPFTRGADVPYLMTESFSDKVLALEGMQARRYPQLGFLPSIIDLVPPDTVNYLPRTLPSETSQAERQIASIPETLIPPDNDEQHGPDALPQDPVEDLRADPVGADRVRANPAARAEQVARSGKGPHGCKMVLLRWMSGTTPHPGSVISVVLRSLVDDLVDLYEPNRREAARILVQLPHWLPKGLFGGRTDPEIGMSPHVLEWDSVAESPDRQSIWGVGPDSVISGGVSPFILEDMVMESLLSMAMLLPRPPYSVLYYATLLREVVSLAPGTVAPAIGKTLRRLFAALATGEVEPELVHRTISWFSVHLSNFNYGWAWAEWVPAMSEPVGEPRRTLVVNLVQEIVRLAYYDRIKGVLPPPLADTALPPEEPAPMFEYAPDQKGGDPRLSHLVRPAQKVLLALRTKLPSEEVHSLLDRLKRSLLASPAASLEDQGIEEPLEEEFLVSHTDEATGGSSFRPLGGAESDLDADKLVGEIAVECLLLLGSRSFSHLLNIVERYHGLLRGLSETEAMRVAMLSAALRFWSENDEWGVIVADKLLQYRIVEPNDVLTLIFSETRDWSRPLWGTLAVLAVEKAGARVGQLRTRAPGPETSEEDEAKRSQALASVEAEHRRVLVALVLGLSAGLNQPSEGGDWARYWQLGWYKQILRVFHEELQAHAQTVSAALASAYASAEEYEQGVPKKLLDQACFLGTE